jgi:DNA polymerase-3 subunit epsilon
LDSRAGDRIISIGAVRIVKLRMLKEEFFDRLVNPQRDIPAKSTKIHGIDDEMVRSQPGIDKILPMFYQFADDTILVAHNAAFDMRMLQTCETQTGIRFINPVLDTLLLSAVVHPNQDDHSLEVIAGRLGVEIHDRHTAMGDALITGEIFLKLIPLLESMGLRTLKAVREASEKTYYARLKY